MNRVARNWISPSVLVNLKNKGAFSKLSAVACVFYTAAIPALKNRAMTKLLHTYKTDAGLVLQHRQDNLTLNIYAHRITLALLTKPLLPIIDHNIPAKPMTTSVVTLKSCGFFMSAI